MQFLQLIVTLGVIYNMAVNGFLFLPATMYVSMCLMPCPFRVHPSQSCPSRARASTQLGSTAQHRPSSPSELLRSSSSAGVAGYFVAKSPLLNKGTSFTAQERDAHGLRGLVPAGEPLSLETKVALTIEQLRTKATPLDKYIYLHTLQDADETLYYATLVQHTAEVMPIVYTPTVGQACQEWSHITRHTPRGLYLSLQDKGQIRKILDNWLETARTDAFPRLSLPFSPTPHIPSHPITYVAAGRSST